MPWDPFRDLVALHEGLERLAGTQQGSWTPPMDLYETERDYVVIMEVPGLRRDELEIDLADDRLTVRGRRGARDPDPAHYHQIERGHGPFARTVSLPHPIRIDAIVADLRDGILTITLPKAPRPQPRQISVT